MKKCVFPLVFFDEVFTCWFLPRRGKNKINVQMEIATQRVVHDQRI